MFLDLTDDMHLVEDVHEIEIARAARLGLCLTCRGARYVVIAGNDGRECPTCHGDGLARNRNLAVLLSFPARAAS